MFVVKVPGINGLGKTKGCEKAGNAILKSLDEIGSNERGIPIDVKLLDLGLRKTASRPNSPLNVADKVELEEIHLNNSNVELSNKLIYKNALEMFGTKSKIVFLGGDHSISFSTAKAFLDYCRQNNKKPCLIVFDAHADCMKPMKEPTHEEWLRALIEKGFPAENVLLVGTRNIWKDEIIFLKEKRIKIISMNQLNEDLQDICDTIMEFSNGKELYVSVDIDVVEPVFAPGTGYQEPGGLASRQLIYLIQRINKMKNLRAVDIVEVNPEKDKDNLTVKLGVKILSELI